MTAIGDATSKLVKTPAEQLHCHKASTISGPTTLRTRRGTRSDVRRRLFGIGWVRVMTSLELDFSSSFEDFLVTKSITDMATTFLVGLTRGLAGRTTRRRLELSDYVDTAVA